MLGFLFNKKVEVKKDSEINEIYQKLKEIYDYDSISEDRKNYLKEKLEKFGYLPYPHIQALEELSPAETLFALEIKWKQNGIFEDGFFKFENNQVSPLKRTNQKDSNWIKKEGHDLKLINLAALGNGNKTEETGKFIDWLKQLLILPSGRPEKEIFSTTVYLVPFHPREFGCAYLPTSSDVSTNIEDKKLKDELNIDVKAQVKTFITLAQLAGHPVIYDVLPQTGRFAKVVLANPHIARWFDINELAKKLENCVDEVIKKIDEEIDSDDIEIIKDLYKQELKGNSGDLTERYKTIYDKFKCKIDEYKKELSEQMCRKESQIKLQKRVREIISAIHGEKSNKKFEESDIIKQSESIQSLIKEGLWPAPGGAWCSASVPVFEKMSECGSYPLFSHFDHKGQDVSCFANLDCQTPYYFAFLEDGSLNENVIDFFICEMKKLQSEYNFDGFRIDHIDHVVDEVSEKDGLPISYRIPRLVLKKLNTELKQVKPYFATLAEYMLWDGYFKEYHEDMNFDILWGNDIISQFEKTPLRIIEDNQELEIYNSKNTKHDNLSILKTYNNQDGEFRAIDQYPGQLGANGALFKWFKYKFLPGGKNAQRPVLYVDGDESFTQTGTESVIGNEISLKRANNKEFFKKFDAINRFAKSQELVTEGEAQIINQDEDGFSAWLISKEPLKNSLLVVANYQYEKEKVSIEKEDGSNHTEIIEGEATENKSISLPGDYKIISEFIFNGEDFVEEKAKTDGTELVFETLNPSEFRIFLLNK